MNNIHFTRVSSNAKTGPIPVSTSSAKTCPNTCPLKDNGCYAASGPLSWHWNKITKGERGVEYSKFINEIKSLPNGTLWRHNVAGDLEHSNGAISVLKLWQLIEANKGKRGFTYTHHDMAKSTNKEAVELANMFGFTVNLSANSLEHADTLSDLDVGPVVTVLPTDQTSNTVTPNGRKVVVCPATVKEGVTCATCKLCAKSDRTAIVGFPAHGTGKRKATEVAITWSK